jgi:tetratricopeptide (TPR) repeat protein
VRNALDAGAVLAETQFHGQRPSIFTAPATARWRLTRRKRLSAGVYSTRDAARLLGVGQAQVRAYIRAGLISCDRDETGNYRLSFQDLVVLRVAAKLLAGSARRVHTALRAARNQIGNERRLSELKITAHGRSVVVQDGKTAWHPESGQLVLELDGNGRTDAVAPLGERRAEADRDTAEQWYVRGMEIEDSDAAGARAAYERALEIFPGHADAHIDLGHLLHEQGDPAAAEAHYRKALEARARDATASYNLGVALEDLGRKDEAIAAYEDAILWDAELADAYWNVSELYHEQGRGQAALRAMKTYLRLTKGWPR